MINPTKLPASFRETLKVLENSSKHFLISGRAGTGKSTLLRLFAKTTHKNIAIVAPTGVAALNAGGQTIHSFFGFPPRIIDPSELEIRRVKKIYKKLETLIIDEISMVRADMIDLIDVFLRKCRKSDDPFGGVQLLLFGDLMQIPPVIAHSAEKTYLSIKYKTPYFFSAQALDDGYALQNIQLDKVFRQEEPHFIKILDQIRMQKLDWDDLDWLNQQCVKEFDDSLSFITLSARNATVDKINNEKLSSLEGPQHVSLATTTGEFSQRATPAETILKLKKGAQVMMLKNDQEGKYVNGSIGKILEIEDNEVLVQISHRNKVHEIKVEQTTWETLKYKMDGNRISSEVVGTFEQLPLKLAWAITIHKSQGKTFDRALIDLGRGAFAPGQTYVALSRCRSLEGLAFSRPLKMSDIIVDPELVSFQENLSRI